MYRKALRVSVQLREALAHGKCCNSVGAGKDFPGVLLAVVLLLLAVREASAASDVWSPLARCTRLGLPALSSSGYLEQPSVPAPRNSSHLQRNMLLHGYIALPSLQRQVVRTGKVKVRFFRSRAAYNANSDATRQRGRLTYFPTILLAGDIELNPGPSSTPQNSFKLSDGSKDACVACPSTSSRKAAITCDNCGKRWHTSCAKLTLAQARALSTWHCSRCRGTPAVPPVSCEFAAVPHMTNQSFYDEAPTTLSKRLAVLRRGCAVVKRIPKAARVSTADCLTKIIDKALSEPNAENWERFLSFAFVALRAPAKTTVKPRLSAASVIKKQVTDMESGFQPVSTRHTNTTSRETPPDDSTTRRVLSKCADGDIRAALKILTSNEDFVPLLTRQLASSVRSTHQRHPTRPFLPHHKPTTPVRSRSRQSGLKQLSSRCRQDQQRAWTG